VLVAESTDVLSGIRLIIKSASDKSSLLLLPSTMIFPIASPVTLVSKTMVFSSLESPIMVKVCWLSFILLSEQVNLLASKVTSLFTSKATSSTSMVLVYILSLSWTIVSFS